MKDRSMRINGSVRGIITSGDGNQYQDIQISSGHETKKDSVEVAAEIQQILNELAENPRTARESVATAILREELNDKPKLKKRLFQAFQAGGIEALRSIFDHPVVNISVEIVRGFLEEI